MLEAQLNARSDEMKITCVGAVFVFACTSGMAMEQIIGKVTYVEPTYLPAIVQFTIDSGSTSCPVGQYLKWQKSDQSNNKAVYGTLLLALTTGKRVRLYVNDGDTTCTGQYLHVLPD
jgi:hypothetical protein